MTTTRFLTPATGITPTAAAHLTTKSYVDSLLGGLRARDVAQVTNVAIAGSGIASTTVATPASAPTDGSAWTWLPATSHAWRSVPASTGDLLVYQLRALLGNAEVSTSIEAGFDIVVMDSATGTPKRWLSAAPATPLVPSQWGPADMQYFDSRWNVNTLPPVAINVAASDISADGHVHLTLGYKPLATNGFRLEATATDPGYVTLLNYGNGTAPGSPVPSHSALTGLSNDDHPQYLTTTRGDARYLQYSAWPPEPDDTASYGDLLSSAKRSRITNSTTLSNGFYTLAGLIAPKAFTATKIRFYVASAGVAGGSPTFTLGVYGGPTLTALPRLSTVPVVSTTLTSTGIKEFTLATPFAVVAGQRYVWMSYVAPSSYTTAAGLGCTATHYAGLNNPSATQLYNGFKAASTAAPATINVADGSWTSATNTIWWSLL